MTGFSANYVVGFDKQGVIGCSFNSFIEKEFRSAFDVDSPQSIFSLSDFFDCENLGVRYEKRFERVVVEVLNGNGLSNKRMLGGLTVDPQRVGVVFSSSKNTFSDNRVLDLFDKTSDAPANYLAKRIGARGPRLSPVAACATGAHAMIFGAQLIEDGYADVAICGAIEPILTPLVLAAYENMGALSKNHLMRPFDQKRDGFVPNVGAGCLILENEEKARERGAQIFGYLSGWAMNADATHMTAMCPSGSSIARAIEYSMRRANVSQIDYINAHGTATKLNDETEAHGIKSALGNNVPVSSTKPLTGHLLGAAGAVEAVISLLALRENFAPPTLNLENTNDNCDLDLVVGKGRDIEMQSVLSLNYGFGGHIGALLFTKT